MRREKRETEPRSRRVHVKKTNEKFKDSTVRLDKLLLLFHISLPLTLITVSTTPFPLILPTTLIIRGQIGYFSTPVWLKTHIFQRAVLTCIPLLGIKTQEDDQGNTQMQSQKPGSATGLEIHQCHERAERRLYNVDTGLTSGGKLGMKWWYLNNQAKGKM